MKSLKFSLKMAILMLIIVIAVVIIAFFSIRKMNEQKEISITTLDTAMRTDFDTNLKEQMDTAMSMLQRVYDQYQAGVYTRQEAETLAADTLRNMRFGDGCYFWADKTDGTCVVLLGSETEGTNRADTVDAKGLKLVQTVKEQALNGGGYTDYYFPRAGETEPLPKRGYSAYFEPFDWVVGTGTYTDFIDTQVNQQKEVVDSYIRNSIVNLLVIIVIALVITTALGLFIIRGIAKPLRKLNHVTNDLANGNLDAELDITGKDEIGQLAQSTATLTQRLKLYIDYIDETSELLNELGQGNLNLVFKNSFEGEFAKIKEALTNTASMLNDTLSQISISTEQVASGSNQVASGAQALASGSTEQASAVTELSATIDDISKQIMKTAEHATTAKEISAESNQATEVGKEKMQQMIASMNDISTSSHEISKIIKAIDDIAFQTNILALNAAVEAARAGTAGKGFAVVAEEVRNLAKKSAESAKNTAVLIDHSLHAVEQGTVIVSETAESLDLVVQSSGKVLEIIQSIADASEDEASSIQQVNEGVNQISAVIHSISATAEESAAASEELSSQSALLESLLNQFKLKT